MFGEVKVSLPVAVLCVAFVAILFVFFVVKPGSSRARESALKEIRASDTRIAETESEIAKIDAEIAAEKADRERSDPARVQVLDIGLDLNPALTHRYLYVLWKNVGSTPLNNVRVDVLKIDPNGQAIPYMTESNLALDLGGSKVEPGATAKTPIPGLVDKRFPGAKVDHYEVRVVEASFQEG